MISLEDLLTKGVDKVYPTEKELKERLEKGKLKIYLGIDPSNAQIHLGNAVPLRKLRQFQELGHKVILLIGDFTGMIGDPTDKSTTRTKLSRQQVLENAKTYKEQAAKILNFEGENPAEIKFNSEWLDKLSFKDVIELASNLTVQQLEERDMFVQRKKEGKPIHLNEFLYPLMQGYDSVAMEVDIELGGTDQTFNMLIGRHLMKTLKNKDKFVLTVPLLLGTNGEKMGKSVGNFIAITENPKDMFGKVMSIKDDLIEQYFELTTDIDSKTLSEKNPLDLKKDLAFEIVKQYHSEKDALEAETEFERVFQKGGQPRAMEKINVTQGRVNVVDFLVSSRLVESKSQARRLIEQGAVKIDNRKIDSSTEELALESGTIAQVGKFRTVEVKINA